MKKILILTDNEQHQINGVAITFKNIETHAVADGYDIVYLDPGQFYHINCPGYPEVKLSLPWRIGQKIKKLEPDYIHIATEGPIGLAGRCWLDRKGWRYNTSYHTKFPEFLKKIYGIPENWTYRYVRWFHKHSGKVLTTTKSMVDELKKHDFSGEIIPWTRGVDRELLKPNIYFPHNNNPPIVLYAGRVSKEKNLDALCLLSHHYNVKIVGDGPYRKHLQEKYPGVEFVGYKYGSDLANYYSMADVFCFPSMVDTFGIVIIEALSVGTPVAAYPVQGPMDILEQGKTGYMHENLAIAIENCLELDRALIKEHSKMWSWSNCWNIFKNNLVEIW
jgi:glycosyltransferase involved in cell wall biosynthesis